MRTATTRVTAGRVNADGTPAAGSGFTSRKLGAGNCVVSFPPGFRLTSATVTVGGGTAAMAAYGFTADAFQTLTAGSVDQPFSFLATGAGV
jgi:hypothetical protein